VQALLADLAAWLEGIGFVGWVRGGRHIYPLANSVHLLGLVMLVGGIGIVDLRIAGMWRALPVAILARSLTPIAVAGLGLMVASGLILFAADGEALSASAMFHRKLVLVTLALANALVFRLIWQRRIERGMEPPLPARAMAIVSLLLWLAAGTAGRLIAYT
jgi:hypothetical protein